MKITSTQSKTLLVVKGLIVNDNNELLILKRNDFREYNPGLWELPGGKINNGEDLYSAFERQIDKESNLTVSEIGKLQFVQSKIVTEGKYYGFSYYEITLSAKYVGGKVVIDTTDHTEFKWVSTKEILDKNLSYECKKAIGMYIERMKYEKIPPTILVSRALIYNDNNEILLLKRNPIEDFGNLWELPGGKLQSFESINEHLVREVLEETGYVIHVEIPFMNVASLIPKIGKYKGMTVINIVSKASINAGRLKISPEHQKFAWVKPVHVLDYDLAEYVRLSLSEILLPKRDIVKKQRTTKKKK